MRTRLGPADELHPLLDQGLPGLVSRMGLAGDDELHRTLRIGQQPQQPLRIVQQQVRSLVGGKTTGEAQGQGVGIEQMPRRSTASGGAPERQVTRTTVARVVNERRAGGVREIARACVGDPANVLLQSVRGSQPAVLAAGLSPQLVGRR